MSQLLQDYVVSYSLISARTAMFIVAFPFFGSPAVPRVVKASLVLALSLFWLNELQTLPAQELRAIGSHWFLFVLMLVKEGVVGGIFGYAFGLFLLPFRIAGEFIGQEMGLTIAQISDPTRPMVGTPVGQLFDTTGMMMFFGLDFHHVFFGMFHASFAKRPVGHGVGEIAVADYLNAMVMAQQWGMMLVAPVLCWLFLISVILALMARAAPQLNIMNIGFILRLLAGLVGTMLLLPEFAPTMPHLLQRFAHILYAL